MNFSIGINVKVLQSRIRNPIKVGEIGTIIAKGRSPTKTKWLVILTNNRRGWFTENCLSRDIK